MRKTTKIPWALGGIPAIAAISRARGGAPCSVLRSPLKGWEFVLRIPLHSLMRLPGPCLPSVRMCGGWFRRANGLGQEGGTFLAAGLARNCGILKELVVADNRMGPRVATLVAASMRGGTSQCLRGFGYRPAAAPLVSLNQQRDDGQSHENRGDGNPESSLKKDAENGPRGSSLILSQADARGAKGAPSLPTGAAKRSSSATGRVPRFSAASMRQSVSGLQRTSALASSALSSRSSLTTVSGSVEGTLTAGSASANQITAVAAAFEEDLGRPQTAGTASG